MLITDALLGEHSVFHLLMQHIGQSLPDFDSTPALQRELAAFAFALESQARLEDELLFAALEPRLGIQGGPLAVMRMEHNRITKLFERIQSAADLELGRALAVQMIEVCRDHFQKEEQILFHMARKFLGEEELSALGAQWLGQRIPLAGLNMP